MGTLLMVAVTLVAGAAVFGFVNGQAALSESQYGNSVANNVNYLNEHFVVVSVQFESSAGSGCTSSGGNKYCQTVLISVYNNGAVGLSIKQITLSNVTSKSTSGVAVPKLSVTSNTTSTIATGQSGKYLCSSSGIASKTIAKNAVPPTVFTFTLPACVPLIVGILDGASYQVQVLGAFGNLVTEQVTASG